MFTGDIVAGIGFKNTRTGDTPLRPGHRDRAREPRVPRAGHPRRRRAQDQGRPGQDEQGALRARPRRTRPSRSAPTRRPARPSSPAWASCTSRCSSTACSASSRSTPPSASRRWPTARRSPRRSSKHTYTHKKQTGGSGQYAEVTIDLEPTGPGGGYEFVDKISGGRIPKEYIPSVDAGIQQSLDAGVLAGYPTVDVRAILTDGKYHDVDSSEMAFKIAGVDGVQGGRPQGQAGPARADHVGRGRHARGLHGRRHRRPQLPPRPASVAWTSGATARSSGPRAAVGDVRVLYRPAFAHPGPRHLHDAVRQLPADALHPCRKRSSPASAASSTPVTVSHRRESTESSHGQGEVRAEQAPCERGDDGSHRSWEDDVDGGDHEGVGGGERERAGDGVR